MRKGFTLIELSIVILIIGILVTAIVTGQSLIQSAKVHTVVSDINKYRKSYFSFIEKFNRLPGDITTAQEFWSECVDHAGPPVNPCNGNGDNRIAQWKTEGIRTWQHMYLAGIISVAYTGVISSPEYVLRQNIPSSSFEGSGYNLGNDYPTTIYGRLGNVLQFAGIVGNQLWGGIITAQQAYIIDSKLDDGLADSGKLFTLKGRDASATPAAGCVTNSWTSANSSYILSDSSNSCRLYFWIDE